MSARTKTKSWWIRITRLFYVILWSLVIVGLSRHLVWNEFKGAFQLRILNECIKVVTEIGPNPRGEVVFEPKLNGKLVHVNGFVQSSEPPNDLEFGIVPNRRVVLLRRSVKMLQWKEYSQFIFGTTNNVYYRQEWSSTLINSNNFYNATEEQRNPDSFLVTPKTFIATNASLREYPFVLSSDIIQQLDQDRPEPRDGFGLFPSVDSSPSYSAVVHRTGWYVPLNKSWCNYAVRRIPDRTKQIVQPKSIHVLRTQFFGEGRGFYIGKNPNKPQVGDIRVTYSVVPEQQVSIVGQQKADGSLTTYSTGSIISRGTLLLVNPGHHNASEVLQQAICSLVEQLSYSRQTGVIRIFHFSFLGLLVVLSFLTQSVLGLYMQLPNFCVSYVISLLIGIVVCLPILIIAKIVSQPVELLCLEVGAILFGWWIRRA